MNHSYPILHFYVDKKNISLYNSYVNSIEKHNTEVLNSSYPNSGFDLFFPERETFYSIKTKMVDFQVKAEMKEPSAFYLYPRSSISKTPLLLSNHVGIIDSGYRGFLIGAFRNLDTSDYTVEEGQRLLQICAADLKPFLVKLVDENGLSKSERGNGGFGSTG